MINSEQTKQKIKNIKCRGFIKMLSISGLTILLTWHIPIKSYSQDVSSKYQDEEILCQFFKANANSASNINFNSLSETFSSVHVEVNCIAKKYKIELTLTKIAASTLSVIRETVKSRTLRLMCEKGRVWNLALSKGWVWEANIIGIEESIVVFIDLKSCKSNF